jgi:hypothetical protein
MRLKNESDNHSTFCPPRHHRGGLVIAMQDQKPRRTEQGALRNILMTIFIVIGAMVCGVILGAIVS